MNRQTGKKEPVARWIKISVYYVCSLVQGICLILLPASSFLFKSPEHHALTDPQYGNLFLPMVTAASLSTLFFGKLDRRAGKTRLFWGGMCSNLLFLVFAGAAYFSEKSNVLTVLFLFTANLFLGLGFGLFMTVLNIYSVVLFPRYRNAVLTGLHSCLGIGAASAPVLVEKALRFGLWPWLAVSIALFWGVLGIAAGWMRADAAVLPVSGKPVSPAPGRMPAGAWLFLGTLVVYGVIESVSGNWCVIYFHQDKAFSMETASLALSFLWLSITAGRIFSALVSTSLDARHLYRLSPFIIFAGLLGFVLNSKETLAVATAMTLGLGCSCFFPLSISLSTHYFDAWRERLAGLATTALMTGVGIGSSLTGFLRDRGVLSLGQVFGGLLFCAAGIGVLAWKLTRAPIPASAS